MNKKTKILISVVVVLLVVVSITFNTTKSQVKIGVVTPLTGGAAYWGESASVGFEMAKQELQDDGIDVEIIVEDGQLDPSVALNAAQKLVNVDGVDAIYSEYNPASVAVASFLKGKDTFHLHNSAATSPLDEGPYNFKTYLDYRDGCGDVSRYIKENNGVSRVGVLKINLELGDLCVDGIVDIFGEENVFVESYNPGITDYRTMINKINNQEVDAIIHGSFQPETLSSLRQLNELGVNQLFVGFSETITSDIVGEYLNLIEADVFWGLPTISEDLKDRIEEQNGGPVADYNAVGLAYVHMLQLGRAIDKCGDNNDCVADYISKVEPIESIGFKGFENRIAEFDNRIVEFRNGEFVEVK